MTPRLRPATFDDYQQIVGLETTLSADVPSEAQWRLRWTGNPLWPTLEQRWPIGWVMEAHDGKIVGSIGNIPLRYYFRGEPLVATTGRGWVVAPEYRGFALWLLEERFNQSNVDLFIDTTISPLALAAFDAFALRVPVGDWETIAYFVTGHRAFATRALQKLNVPLAPIWATLAGPALRLKESLIDKKPPQRGSSLKIDDAETFDSRFDLFWQELLRQNPDTLLAARDSATLAWYFSCAMRARRLWILTATRSDRLVAYCIFKRQSAEGQLARMRLVDYQTLAPEDDPLADFLAIALQRCAVRGVSVLDRPGVGVTQTHTFDAHAPYRAKQSWPFFYRAVSADLAAQLALPQAWAPSAYDGDASFE
ncbi:MAG: hypothetical protein JO030_04270 [Candidatus Eremiobacteraeota bacterium]|nr:hypothetical protein [Candidatus Eremiobacteraeota bacterium]